MSILFVLITFLLIISISYFLRHGEQPQAVKQAMVIAGPQPPRMSREFGFEIPKGYCFHLGHTWALDEGRQNARVGIDNFAANLLGTVDRIEVAGLNRWVRQGQKICTITSGNLSIDVLSPLEGVVISVNQDVLKNPNLAMKDPYKDGWICVVKAPEMDVNLKNLVQGAMVGPWMQNALRRLGTITAQLGPAMAQDGGLPVSGLLRQVEPGVQQAIIKEVFVS